MEGIILNADALVALRKIPSGVIDLCLTSPPYWQLRDYGTEGQLGQEQTPEAYIEKLCLYFDEVKRVLKDRGTLWVNLGDKYFNKSLCQIPAMFSIEMVKRGWFLRNEIIWHKPNCMPSPVKDRFTIDFEKLFFFSKEPNYYFKPQYDPFAQSSLDRAKYAYLSNRPQYGADGVNVSPDGFAQRFLRMPPIGGIKRAGGDNATYSGNAPAWKPEGRNKRCVWTLPTSNQRTDHAAAYPEKLCEIPIKAGCPEGGIVLDPFAGTGTSLAVAKRLKRRYVGIELNPQYCRIITARLNGEHRPATKKKIWRRIKDSPYLGTVYSE